MTEIFVLLITIVIDITWDKKNYFLKMIKDLKYTEYTATPQIKNND